VATCLVPCRKLFEELCVSINYYGEIWNTNRIISACVHKSISFQITLHIQVTRERYTLTDFAKSWTLYTQTRNSSKFFKMSTREWLNSSNMIEIWSHADKHQSSSPYVLIRLLYRKFETNWDNSNPLHPLHNHSIIVPYSTFQTNRDDNTRHRSI
jgi:hypothetical protein